MQTLFRICMLKYYKFTNLAKLEIYNILTLKMKTQLEENGAPPKKKQSNKANVSDLSYTENMYYSYYKYLWKQYVAEYITTLEKDMSKEQRERRGKENFQNQSIIENKGSQLDISANQSIRKLINDVRQQNEVNDEQNQSQANPFAFVKDKVAPSMKKKMESEIIQVRKEKQSKNSVKLQEKQQASNQNTGKNYSSEVKQIKLAAKRQDVEGFINEKSTAPKAEEKKNASQLIKEDTKTLNALVQKEKIQQKKKDIPMAQEQPKNGNLSPAASRQYKPANIQRQSPQKQEKTSKNKIAESIKTESQQANKNLQQQEQEVVQQEEGSSFYQLVSVIKQEKSAEKPSIQEKVPEITMKTDNTQKSQSLKQESEMILDVNLSKFSSRIDSPQSKQDSSGTQFNSLSTEVLNKKQDKLQDHQSANNQVQQNTRLINNENSISNLNQRSSANEDSVKDIQIQQPRKADVQAEIPAQEEKNDEVQPQEYIDQNHFVTCIQNQESKNQTQLEVRLSALQDVQDNCKIFQQEKNAPQNQLHNQRVNSFVQSFYENLQNSSLLFNEKLAQMIAEMQQIKQRQLEKDARIQKLMKQKQQRKLKSEQLEKKNSELAQALQRQKKHNFDHKMKIQAIQSQLKQIQDKEILIDAKQMHLKIKRDLSQKVLPPKSDTPQNRKIQSKEEKKVYNSDQESGRNPSDQSDTQKQPIQNKEDYQSEKNQSDIEEETGEINKKKNTQAEKQCSQEVKPNVCRNSSESEQN